ncbi:hypothetical protein EV645_0091 [Kribbella rubisoli]|uniref:Uncharacterized protein n=1 Tax=Kribbella rubisoli TaxID=3075929 RepID=A0A4Q7XNF2_9ACTN|nr:hypothetical protein [Kribbella rubisoli]RZU24449.1 hypothetical protein EV645_0091 [Kribbella rubisoli]
MSRRTISLVLLVVALGLLFAGGFVQFDDTSGFGDEQWILLLGGLALVLALASVVAAWPQPQARLWLGIALAVLTGLLVLGSISNDGFRFIWNRSEGELALLEFATGLVAFVLIANGVQPAPTGETAAEPGADRPGPGRWLVRAAAYLCGTMVAVLVAIAAGADYFTRTECSDDGDCLALLGGFVWGAVAVLACGLAVLVIEIVLWRRRRGKTAEVGGG